MPASDMKAKLRRGSESTGPRVPGTVSLRRGHEPVVTRESEPQQHLGAWRPGRRKTLQKYLKTPTRFCCSGEELSRLTMLEMKAEEFLKIVTLHLKWQ